MAVGPVAPVSARHQLDYCPTPSPPFLNRLPDHPLPNCLPLPILSCLLRTLLDRHCLLLLFSNCPLLPLQVVLLPLRAVPHWLQLPFPRCLLSSFSEPSTVTVSEVSAVAVSKSSTTVAVTKLSTLPSPTVTEPPTVTVAATVTVVVSEPPLPPHSQSRLRSNSRPHSSSRSRSRSQSRSRSSSSSVQDQSSSSSSNPYATRVNEIEVNYALRWPAPPPASTRQLGRQRKSVVGPLYLRVKTERAGRNVILELQQICRSNSTIRYSI